MAEVLLRHVAGAGDLQVSSAGVGGYGRGFPVTPPTADVLGRHGLDGAAHRSREATPQLLEEADLIIGMTRDHVQRAVALQPAAAPRTFTLTEASAALAATGARRPGEDERSFVRRVDAAREGLPPQPEVPDPVLEPELISYDEAFALISRHVTAVGEHL